MGISNHYAVYTTAEGDDLVGYILSDRLQPVPGSGVKLIAQNAARNPSYGDITKKVDFANFRKYKLTGAGPVFVLTERTDMEIRASQEYIDVKAIRILGGGTHLTYKGTTSSLTYTDTGSLTFAGSDLLGTILAVTILFRQTGSAGTSSVRLQDITNNLTICEITGLTNEGKIKKDMGAISNVPTGEVILELQVKVGDVANTAKTFELHIAH